MDCGRRADLSGRRRNRVPDQEPERDQDQAQPTVGAFLDEVEATGADHKRRGRPKGAVNRKTKEMAERWEAAGLADPLLQAGARMSVDPVSLQRWIIDNDPSLVGLSAKQKLARVPSLMDIMDYQRRLAVDVMPYLHGKKPTEIVVTDERLPTFIVDLGGDRLSEMRQIEHDTALSLGVTLDAEDGQEIDTSPVQREEKDQ